MQSCDGEASSQSLFCLACGRHSPTFLPAPFLISLSFPTATLATSPLLSGYGADGAWNASFQSACLNFPDGTQPKAPHPHRTMMAASTSAVL